MSKINRRSFIKRTTALASGLTLIPRVAIPSTAANAEFEPFPARYWETLSEGRVKCTLCPKECQVADRERGYCGVRENIKGKYYTLVHSRLCAAHIDPIEKKPLYHFLPGTNAFSIATAGCNMECKFCQNWEISQFRPEQVRATHVSPTQIAASAKRNRAKSIAYTYTEPVIFYEYMYDCAVAGNEVGLRSVMISNGYIQKKPMRELAKVLSAVKIDLKAFTENFYKKYCSGTLKPVLEILEVLKEEGIWFEIVVLIIPTLNDSLKENRQMARWIRSNLGPDVPVHFTRFHPTYKIKNLPRTPVKTLENIHKVAKDEGLNFAYIGNLPGHKADNTYCPKCSALLIRRWGFKIIENNIEKSGNCKKCGACVPGIWS